MKLKDYFRRNRIKKTSGHLWFYHDKTTNFDFFYHFTPTNDVSIMSYDIVNRTYREFVLDDEIVRSMFEVLKGKEITPHTIKSGEPAMLDIAKDYINAGFTLIKKSNRSKFANINVLVKLTNFEKENAKSKQALILRRIVFNDTLVIGMDTLAIPLDGIKAFISKIEKEFVDENKLYQRSIKENAIN